MRQEDRISATKEPSIEELKSEIASLKAEISNTNARLVEEEEDALFWNDLHQAYANEYGMAVTLLWLFKRELASVDPENTLVNRTEWGTWNIVDSTEDAFPKEISAELEGFRSQLITIGGTGRAALSIAKDIATTVPDQNRPGYNSGIKRAGANHLGFLSPVLASIYAGKESGDEGMAAIYRQIANELEHIGAIVIEPKKGDKFDVNLHEVIDVEGGAEAIVRVVSPGLTLNGRLLFPAKIVV